MGDGAVDFNLGCAYVDDCYVPIDDAKISVLDWGFSHSDVTYDVAHVWKGRFFRLEDHLERFARSCAALRLEAGVARDQQRDIAIACVRRSGLRDAYVEIGCTRGRSAPGSRDPRTCTNRFFAYAIPFVWAIAPDIQARGAHVIIADIPRIPPASLDPTVKNFHWGDMTSGLFEAIDKGADTVVLTDLAGNISEGPGFNVFCVKDGTVATPGGTVLEGITRATVREMCAEIGLRFEVRDVTPDDLRQADEAFLSSTAGGVMPVARVDEHTLSNDAPGAITMRLSDLYWAKHEDERYATAVDYGD